MDRGSGVERTYSTEQLDPPKRWWLARWVREEKFWQDITTRTLAALIVLAMGYLYALFAGYINEPRPARAWASAVVVLLITVFVVAWVAVAVYCWVKNTSGPFASRGLTLLGTIVFVPFIAGFGALAFWLLELIWGS